MPRPRLPVAELERRGSFAKDPQRRRVDPETVGPLDAAAPKSLTPPEAEWWVWIIANAHKDVLSAADKPAVMLTARLLALADQEGAEMTAAKMQMLRVMLGALGMTPSDRSKVAAVGKDKKPAQDDWANFTGIADA